MASDQQVTSRLILQVLARAKRGGSMKLVQELEQVEPDLTEHVLESLTTFRQRLFEIGASARQTQRLYLDVQQLVVVVITALRRGQYELWKHTEAGERLAELDPSLADDEPPSSAADDESE